MDCRVCHRPLGTSFSEGRILDRNVEYFECAECGYVQTEEPTWLDEAYSSPINLSDTGIMARNLSNVNLTLATLTLMGAKSAQVVDYAGGYGLLVRLLRDKGVDAYWADPYSENLVARGFEYSGTNKASLVTAFEAFEHFVRPPEELEKLLTIAPNILLTTTLAPRPAPQPSDWWYYGLEHGQHVGIYRVETVEFLAKKFGLNMLSDGVSVHFLSKKRFSPFAWKFFRFMSKKFPRAFSKGLISKTWSDHLLMSKANVGNSQAHDL